MNHDQFLLLKMRYEHLLMGTTLTKGQGIELAQVLIECIEPQGKKLTLTEAVQIARKNYVESRSDISIQRKLQTFGGSDLEQK